MDGMTFTDAHKVFLCRWGPFSDQVTEVWPEQARHRTFMSASLCPFECPWWVRRTSQVTKRSLLSTRSQKHHLSLVFALSGPLWRLEALSSFKGSPLGVCCGRSPWEVGCWMLISSHCCPWDTFHFRPSRTGEGGWDCVVGAVGMAGKFSLALCCCDQGETLSSLGGTYQWTLLVISPG